MAKVLLFSGKNSAAGFFALCPLLFTLICFGGAEAYQLQSQKELGAADGRNQNVVVKCTTAVGGVSSQTCTLRRFAKCSGSKCSGWQKWTDLRNPGKSYDDWRKGAGECCAAKGLR